MNDTDGAPATSKKASKKASKSYNSNNKPRVAANARNVIPPSLTSSSVQGSSRNQDRFSGLWEFYYHDDEEGVRTEEQGTSDGAGSGADGKGEMGYSDENSQLKNIRGFLMKRRKSPLKGWHKRYFVVEKGFLYFSRTYAQMVKGKGSSSLDLGQAFIHCNGSSRRIDIDGENQVLHLKTKNSSHFSAWSSCFMSQEMYRKTQLASGKPRASKGLSFDMGRPQSNLGSRGRSPSLPGGGGGVDEWARKTQNVISGVKKDLEGIHETLEAMSVYVRSPSGSGVLSATPSTSTGTLTAASNDKMADENSSMHSGTSADSVKGEGSGGGAPKKKFTIRKIRKDKKKESSSSMTPDQVLPLTSVIQNNMVMMEDPIPYSTSSSDQTVIRDDFTAISKLVFVQFQEVMEKLEKIDGGLQKAVETTAAQRSKQDTIISNQLLLLHQTTAQNTDLRERLAQIQSIASGSDSKVHISTPVGNPRRTSNQAYHRGSIPRFDSFMSLQSAMSDKFFDAVEEVHDFSSSEDEAENTEDEESGEDSDNELFTSLPHNVLASFSHTPTLQSSSVRELPITEEDESPESYSSFRRKILPAPISDLADFSLWSLLRKNIGKDLSKVSMPVSMNEPLSALQRMCEELEYSELLDEAAGLEDPFDRMVRVAAFAVSSYALSYHRAGRKPFNPLLGETYECVRQDRGFRFIAEQVSHHPPIAASHCSSPNFEYWQDARIKSKFWGKSMEVFPIGVTNVTLPRHEDHYQWKKVTSCIHNVLGGQRWVDQYGEMTISNKDTCSCKLTFVKASYWNTKKCFVYGDVYDSEGLKVRHVSGAWNEAFYCGNENEDVVCIWRAAEMPLDSEQYYGFSYFAMQLNECLEEEKELLPLTDCRFRPDQRLLENGCLQEAEQEKKRVEQIQREARSERERMGEEWCPNFFTKVEDEEGDLEKWVTNGSYWVHRQNNFKDIDLPNLW